MPRGRASSAPVPPGRRRRRLDRHAPFRERCARYDRLDLPAGWPHRVGLHLFCEGMAIEMSSSSRWSTSAVVARSRRPRATRSSVRTEIRRGEEDESDSRPYAEPSRPSARRPPPDLHAKVVVEKQDPRGNAGTRIIRSLGGRAPREMAISSCEEARQPRGSFVLTPSTLASRRGPSRLLQGLEPLPPSGLGRGDGGLRPGRAEHPLPVRFIGYMEVGRVGESRTAVETARSWR